MLPLINKTTLINFVSILSSKSLEICINCIGICVKPLFSTLFANNIFLVKRTLPLPEMLDLFQR